MTLEPDYSLQEVAKALGMSERWVRRLIADGAEHQRYGHKIRFTAAQVEQLKAQHVSQPATAPKSLTTGRRRRGAA